MLANLHSESSSQLKTSQLLNSHNLLQEFPTDIIRQVSETDGMVENHVPCHKFHQHTLRKGRRSIPGQIYFLTTTTHLRRPVFSDFQSASLISSILHDRSLFSPATNLCWVVMPDHIHCLIELDEVPLNRVMQKLKSKSAIAINQHLGESGQFWQTGYYDHALREQQSLRSVGRYIIANPIRAHLVEHVGDYPFWNAVWF